MQNEGIKSENLKYMFVRAIFSEVDHPQYLVSRSPTVLKKVLT